MAFAFASSSFFAASTFAGSYLDSWLPPPPPRKGASVSDIQADLNKVVNHTIALQDSARKFESGTDSGNLVNAMDIYTNSCTLMKSVDSASRTVNAVQPCPISEDDGRLLFEKLVCLEPAIGSGLLELRNKKEAIAELTRPEVVAVLGAPSQLICSALLTGKQSFINFRAALLAVAPLGLREQAEDLGGQIEAHFDKTIACYQA